MHVSGHPLHAKVFSDVELFWFCRSKSGRGRRELARRLMGASDRLGRSRCDSFPCLQCSLYWLRPRRGVYRLRCYAPKGLRHKSRHKGRLDYLDLRRKLL